MPINNYLTIIKLLITRYKYQQINPYTKFKTIE